MLFITLGPSGTNHEFVTQNYLRFRKLKDADIKLIDNFFWTRDDGGRSSRLYGSSGSAPRLFGLGRQSALSI